MNKFTTTLTKFTIVLICSQQISATRVPLHRYKSLLGIPRQIAAKSPNVTHDNKNEIEVKPVILKSDGKEQT